MGFGSFLKKINNAVGKVIPNEIEKLIPSEFRTVPENFSDIRDRVKIAAALAAVVYGGPALLAAGTGAGAGAGGLGGAGALISGGAGAGAGGIGGLGGAGALIAGGTGGATAGGASLFSQALPGLIAGGGAFAGALGQAKGQVKATRLSEEGALKRQELQNELAREKIASDFAATLAALQQRASETQVAQASKTAPNLDKLAELLVSFGNVTQNSQGGAGQGLAGIGANAFSNALR